nr:AAA family ATPase [Microbacterium bovistercoris]
MPNTKEIAATIRADGSVTLEVDGRVETLATTRPEDARREVVQRAGIRAASLGRSVPVIVTETDGTVQLVVAADGSVTVIEDTHPAPAPADTPVPDAAPAAAAPVSAVPAAAPATAAPAGPAPTTAVPTAAPAASQPASPPVPPSPAGSASPTSAEPASPQPAAPQVAASVAAAAPPITSVPAATPAPTQGEASTPRTQERQSFLKHEQAERPASKGWRGGLVRMGLRVPPNASERAERDDLHAVSQHWPGPRTIAVVNGKGGAGKTPTTINLAAVFARHGGAGVLAWDNNQTRGTLGWRTERGPHESTLLELLPQTGRLLGTSAQSADLARFVHHQTADKYDVLRSKPAVLASEQRITAQDVSGIHAVAAKYYRLIVIDSGNDETDPLWLQMIEHTDQLVIATTTRDDHAEAGALLLEGLAERDERSARLAANAVAVVTQADPKATDADIRHVADGFRAIARDVVSIPFDPTLVDGIITFDALRADTRRAWLAAAAAIARGL